MTKPAIREDFRCFHVAEPANDLGTFLQRAVETFNDVGGLVATYEWVCLNVSGI